MRYPMKEYKLGLYEKAMPAALSWREKLQTAQKAGFDYVELSVDESDERLSRLTWSAGQRRELLALSRELGMPLGSMCLSGHRKYPLGSKDKATERRGLEIMEQAVELAEDLGIRIIQLAGYDVYYEPGDAETRARFGKNLKKAVAMAARGGVTLGFETMETDFMNTVAKAIDYVKLTDSPYLQVYPDLGNLTNAADGDAGAVQDDLETGRGHIVAMHLKETKPGVFREVPFGTGHVDFKSGVNKAWALGVRRYVAEMWYTGNANWEEEIRAARYMLGRVLDNG